MTSIATCKGDRLAHSPPGYVGHAHSLGIIRLQGAGQLVDRIKVAADPDPHYFWGSWIRIRIRIKVNN